MVMMQGPVTVTSSAIDAPKQKPMLVTSDPEEIVQRHWLSRLTSILRYNVLFEDDFFKISSNLLKQLHKVVSGRG